MLQNCARRLRAHHGQLLKARLRRHFAALPRAVSEGPQGEASTKAGIAKRYDALFWPEVNTADVPLDLTKTYVKRYVSKHFDTVIDPQFPAQTGLPMTVYISQKQDHRPASIEVSQFYGNHHSLSDIFTITIPRTSEDSPRMIGDTGAIKLQDLAKAYKFIEVNRNLLLSVWEHGDDEANDVAWKYHKYIVPIV